MRGKVSNIIISKKFGFISGENGQEYFFHITDMQTEWDELLSQFAQKGGNKIEVEFDAVKTPKGPRAKEVMILGD